MLDTRTLCAALTKIVWPYEKTQLFSGFILFLEWINLLYKKVKENTFQCNTLLKNRATDVLKFRCELQNHVFNLSINHKKSRNLC